jgi:broad specificity phosphatase PhoE
MSEQLTVALVRLCECDGNEQELIATHGTLTRKGRTQAEAARDRIRDLKLNVRGWFAPDNSACKETAEIVAGDGRVDLANEFLEPPYPKWRGLTLKQAEEHWSSEWFRYFHPQPGDAERIIAPGGESFRVTYERAKSGLDRLHHLRPPLRTIVVVTHGEVTRLLTVGLLGAPLENLFRLRGQNGAISLFHYDGTAATFECINDTSHLVESKDLTDYGVRQK